MPPVSHFEFSNCRDCGMAVWRYMFYHPGRQYWTHVMPEERDVCPGYLRRKEQNEKLKKEMGIA